VSLVEASGAKGDHVCVLKAGSDTDDASRLTVIREHREVEVALGGVEGEDGGVDDVLGVGVRVDHISVAQAHLANRESGLNKVVVNSVDGISQTVGEVPGNIVKIGSSCDDFEIRKVGSVEREELVGVGVWAPDTSGVGGVVDVAAAIGELDVVEGALGGVVSIRLVAQAVVGGVDGVESVCGKVPLVDAQPMGSIDENLGVEEGKALVLVVVDQVDSENAVLVVSESVELVKIVQVNKGEVPADREDGSLGSGIEGRGLAKSRGILGGVLNSECLLVS
jgi:hypothetical protein